MYRMQTIFERGRRLENFAQKLLAIETSFLKSLTKTELSHRECGAKNTTRKIGYNPSNLDGHEFFCFQNCEWLSS